MRRFNDLGTMEESVEECVESVRSAWEFWRVCERRNNTQFALLQAVPGSGKTSKHCKPSPRYQTTESQRGLGEGKAIRPMCGLRRWSKYTQTIKFTLVPTVRKENRCRHPRTSMHVATQTLVLKCTYVLHACQCTYEDVGTYARSRREVRSQ